MKALLSVFDKTGIVEFAEELQKMGWEIISTGGTFKTLSEKNIKVTDISQVTNFPECFDGRVKTLHPIIHGGLLALRNNQEHIKTMQQLNIEPIDIVVCNLYPFKQTIMKQGVSHEEIIENIDIGGPTMLRAAAKNYHFVNVITDPEDYKIVITQLKETGKTTAETKEYLASKVFTHTAAYDALIANYFNKRQENIFPDKLTLTFEKKQSLRYGENPHQNAAYYSEILETQGSLSDAVQLHGKELSFNNINDANGALETLKEFTEPTVVAVKHANPCAIASAKTISEAYKKAYEADPVSIFGGIVASNTEIDELTANEINNIFLEVVIAPSYSEKALEILKKKKNIRILELSNIGKNDYLSLNAKSVMGGILVQERDNKLLENEYHCVTNREPSQEELEDLMFAWKAVKHTKSNGIAIAKSQQTIGIGPGQVSRIWALENAIRQGGGKVKGAALASDAFFPFSDSVEAAAIAGITAIIQPGGSIKDADSIEAANKYGIAMIFTGIRHFKH